MKLTSASHKLSFPKLLQWTNRPADFLDTCTSRYGDIFTVQFPGGKPVTFVSHPKALEDVLTAPLGTFTSGEGNEMFSPLMGNSSIMLLDGKPHQRLRKLIMPPFHGERMRFYGQHICELTEQMMQSWTIGQSFDLRACTENVPVNVLPKVVFGLTEGERSKQLHEKLLALVNLSTSPLIALHLFFPPLRKDLGAWSPWGRLLRLRDEVDQLIYAEIAQRRQQPESERTDILSLLMLTHDEDGEPVSDQELRDQLISLLMAGFDTTSTALTWALYWIHKLPRVREQLLEELDTINDFSDTRAIAQLPYLTATCQETLRIYPSIMLPFLRVAQTPFQMMGDEFSAGSRIWPNIYSAHHRREVYPDPEQFKPERFLERQFSPYEYLPFGGGNRLCVGSAFALFLIKLVLFTILSRYQLTLVDPRPIHPIRHGPGLAPSRALQMMVTGHHHRRSNVAVLT
ncbi:cytochrome P450 [Nostocales cyanobacterium HT-58-2]|nr:cytochrome P450 [Nostocales cyanobacterium HT-58-2]